MANQDINLTQYDPQTAAIQRQQRLAEMLQDQSQQPIDVQSYNGIQAPISPFSVLAKILQGYGARKLADKAGTALGDLQATRRGQFADMLDQQYQHPAVAAQGVNAPNITPIAPDMSGMAGTPQLPGGPPQPAAPAPQPAAAAKMAPQSYDTSQGGIADAQPSMPTSAQEQLANSLKMMSSGNPYAAQVAPSLYETALKRQQAQQMFQGLDTSNLPPQVAQIAKAYAAQGDLAGALKAIQTGTETKYSGGVAFQPGASGPQVVARANDWKQVDPASAGIPVNAMKPGQIILRNSNGDIKTVSPSDVSSQARFGQEVSLAQQRAQATAGGAAGPDTIANFAANVHSGMMNLQNVPQAFRPKVSDYLAGEGGTKDSPTVATKYTNASSRITAPYTKLSQYQLTSDAAPYIQRMAAAAQHPGSIGDADLLDSLIKLNTGGNAITEAQANLVTGGRSLSDTINVMANKLKTGGVLSDDQRHQILAMGKEIAGNYQKGFKPVYDAATKQLTDANIPKRYWTIPDIGSFQALAGFNGNPGGGKAPPPPPPGFTVHN